MVGSGEGEMEKQGVSTASSKGRQMKRGAALLLFRSRLTEGEVG